MRQCFLKELKEEGTRVVRYISPETRMRVICLQRTWEELCLKHLRRSTLEKTNIFLLLSKEGVLSHYCVLSAQWFELLDLVIGSVLQCLQSAMCLYAMICKAQHV